MPVSIVANLASQYANQAIQLRNKNVTISTEKLSSGQRVFGAEEDAAALAVGSNLKLENATLAKARLNVTSGVSMLQIADGSLSNVQDILVRLKSLATQSANGENSDVDRGLLDQEYQSLTQELDRIAGVTKFNGVAMLAGQPQYINDAASNLSTDGIAVKADPTVVGTQSPVFKVTYDSTSEALTVTRVDGPTPVSQTLDMTAILDGAAGNGQNLGTGQAVEAHFGTLGLTLTLNSAFDRTADIEPTNITNNAPAGTTLPGLVPAGFTPAMANISPDAVAGLHNVGTALNPATGDLTLSITSASGVVTLAGVPGLHYQVGSNPMGASGAASDDLAGATNVDIYVDNASGGTTKIGTLTTTAAIATTADGTGTLVMPLDQGLVAANYKDSNGPNELTYMVGTGVVQGRDLVDVSIPSVTAAALGIAGLDIRTALTSNNAMGKIDDALTQIAASRATVGAQQMRLEEVGGSIDVRTENNEIARSALLDVDVASEITNLTNNQAMLQVGVSMLSQTNRLPQMLLTLLSGNQ